MGLGVSAAGHPPSSASPPLPSAVALTSSPHGGISAPELGFAQQGRAGGGRGRRHSPVVVTAVVTLGGRSEWMGEWGQQSVGVGMAT